MNASELFLIAAIDVEALRAYWDAVEARTIAVVQDLHPADLDNTHDAAHVHEVFAQDGLDTPKALWVRDYMEEQPRGFFLIHLGLNHIIVHRGEALAIRSLGLKQELGRPVGQEIPVDADWLIDAGIRWPAKV